MPFLFGEAAGVWIALVVVAAVAQVVAGAAAGPMTVRIAMYQGGGTNGDKAANMALLDTLAQRATSNHSALLVLPELFNTGYIATNDTTLTVQQLIAAAPAIYRGLAEAVDGPSVVRAQHIAAAHNVAIVFTFLEANINAPDALPFDSAVFIDATGAVLAHYRKVQIVAAVETYFLSVGDRGFGPVFNWSGLTCGMLICNDIVHPEPTDILASMGAQLVFIPTANAAPTLDDNAVSRLYVPVRSNENGVVVVYTNWAMTQQNANLAGLFSFYGGSAVGGGSGASGLQNTLTTAAGLLFVDTAVPPPQALTAKCPAAARDRYPQYYGALSDTSQCVPGSAPAAPCDPVDNRQVIAWGLGIGFAVLAIVVLAVIGRHHKAQRKLLLQQQTASSTAAPYNRM